MRISYPASCPSSKPHPLTIEPRVRRSDGAVGLRRSLLELVALDLKVPGHTTLSTWCVAPIRCYVKFSG